MESKEKENINLDEDGYFGHFVASVVFFQILPLIPLWFEYQHNEGIAKDSLILCASMYAFATGFSSRYQWQLSICFLIGILLAGSYRPVHGEKLTALSLGNSVTFYTIVMVFVMHLIERYSRHVIDKEPFFSFLGKKR